MHVEYSQDSLTNRPCFDKHKLPKINNFQFAKYHQTDLNVTIITTKSGRMNKTMGREEYISGLEKG
jgi:hypothetical protein